MSAAMSADLPLSFSTPAAAPFAAAYKTGVVVAAKPGFARVAFADLDGLQSNWLPQVFTHAHQNRRVATLDVGAQVACLMDAQFEEGCILGAIYSAADTPPTKDTQEDMVRFADGAEVGWHQGRRELRVAIDGMRCTIGSAGIVIIGGDVVVDGISLKHHPHGGVVRGGAQTDPPVAFE